MWMYMVVPDVTYELNREGQVHMSLRGFCDSDWAGCRETRRSTSCCTVYAGWCFPLLFECCSQGSVALSSGEAEFYALGSLATDLLFAKGVLEEVGIKTSAYAYSDSSVARTLATRKGGSRKMRHIEARHLFLQNLVAKKIIEVRPVKGIINVSDLGTKHLATEKLKQLRGQAMIGHSLEETTGAAGENTFEINMIEAETQDQDEERESMFVFILVVALAVFTSLVALVGFLCGKLVGRLRPHSCDAGTQTEKKEEQTTEEKYTPKAETRYRGKGCGPAVGTPTAREEPRDEQAFTTSSAKGLQKGVGGGSMPCRPNAPTMTTQALDETAVIAFCRGTTVDELRVELRRKGLKVGGVKLELAKRVLAHR